MAKKRTISITSFDINPAGGKTTRELFESHGIMWSEEYEEEENMNLFGDPPTEEGVVGE